MYTTFCTSVVYSAFLQKCDVVYVFAPGNVHNVAFSQEAIVHDVVYIPITRKPPSLGASYSLVGDDGLEPPTLSL